MLALIDPAQSPVTGVSITVDGKTLNVSFSITVAQAAHACRCLSGRGGRSLHKILALVDPTPQRKSVM